MNTCCSLCCFLFHDYIELARKPLVERLCRRPNTELLQQTLGEDALAQEAAAILVTNRFQDSKRHGICIA